MDSGGQSFGRFRASLFPSYRAEMIAAPGANLARTTDNMNAMDHLAHHAKIHEDFMATFHNMDAMFEEIDNIMKSQPTPQVQVASHCYSSTKVMSYVSDGRSRPKIYQASATTRQAPGGIKETCKTVRDSESGVEKISIGHQLGDKLHLIERSRNNHTGQHTEENEFVNMDESEMEQFNAEWLRKTSQASCASSHTSSSESRSPSRKTSVLYIEPTIESPYRRLATTSDKPTAT